MIEHKIVNNAIEKARKRVEENNFGIRKRLLEFDDVMNKQRTYIYERRRHAVLGERIGVDVINMLYDTVENLIVNNEAPADYPDLCTEIFRVLAIETPFTEEEYANMQREDKIETLHEAAVQGLGRKSDRIREVALPVLQQMSAANPDYDGPVLVPLTDGKRIFNLRCDLRTAIATEGRSIVKEWHKALMLVTIDELRKEHLRELDQLRRAFKMPLTSRKTPSLSTRLSRSTSSRQCLRARIRKPLPPSCADRFSCASPLPSPCTKTPLRKWKTRTQAARYQGDPHRAAPYPAKLPCY